MSGTKNRNTAPTGDSKASGTTARPGTIDVYSVGMDGSKTYIGWITDKNKLAFFSRAGDRALNPEKDTDSGAMRAKKNNRPAPAKRTAPVTELLLGPNVDKLAGEIVIKWINENSVTEPKPFTLAYDLFGVETIPFEKALRVHHAMSAFDLEREISGQVVRNAIFKYINTRDNRMIPTADDFKNCMEIIDFDGGIVSGFMTQIMWRSVNQNIDQDILDEIKRYCFETGRYPTMVRMGEAVVEKKMSHRKKKGGKPLEHGWQRC
jgi:hypothetical protein